MTKKALDQLEKKLAAEYKVLHPEAPGMKFLDPSVYKLRETEYKAATTEFVLKELKRYLKPVSPIPILQKLVEAKEKDFQPIPIDDTAEYIFKNLLGRYDAFQKPKKP